MEEFSNKLIIPRNSKRHKIIKLPKDLNSFLQTQAITIWQWRIILGILNVIKGYQISDERSPENQQQLELFRLYWSDDNSTATFNFHFQDFVPDGVSYKRGQIEQALKDLVTIGLAEQEEIIDGKNMKRFTGMIFNPIWEQRSHTCSFQMTASWFKIFVIAVKYFPIMYDNATRLSSRAAKFLGLLLTWEYMGKFWRKRNDLCDHFGIEFTRPSIIERDYLFPIREELDKKGELSFNYEYIRELDRWNMSIYRLRNSEADKIIPTIVVESINKNIIKPNLNMPEPKARDIVNDKKIATNAAIKYIIKARKLNEEQKNVLFRLCMKYGYDEIKGIIKNTSKNDVENSFKNLKGADFINKLLIKFPL